MPVANSIPALKKLRSRSGIVSWYWAASQVARSAKAFSPRTERLWRGVGEPSTEELTIIRRRAEQLQHELLEWLDDPTRKTPGKRGTIYFVRLADHVKIGFTRDMPRRLSQLKVALPAAPTLLFTLPGSPAAERALHRRFKSSRANGEWFRFEGPVADFLTREQGQNRPSESPLKTSESP